MPPGRVRRILIHGALVLGSVAVVLLLGEIAVRIHVGRGHEPGGDRTPLHIRCDCPQLYLPNPDHPEISSQGLRDDEVAIPKPPDVRRVLVLGDSVAFGEAVNRSATFPERLEAMLAGGPAPVEVLNAGVAGYTAFNELHDYLDRGRRFEPDLVVVAACLNDVVNPRLHWNYTWQALPEVPDAAIPNPDYDRDQVVPLLGALWDPDRLARAHPATRYRSRLYGWLEARLRSKAETERMVRQQRDLKYRVVGDREWPVYLTGEDTLAIDVLLDYESAEWRWLRSIYDRLIEAVRADGGRVALLVLPLAYQMDADYPYLPQRQFERFCRQRQILCVDPLPALRAFPRDDVFLGRRSGYEDVWHLTAFGHAEVARELHRALVSSAAIGLADNVSR